ncbi:hypothetical protein CQW23_22271 [Capsicum baccatum]|uniref:Aminotransferase-like plant mobile domain-containing protein n=1 Tax=Capsicum baccatum TaxID=33114 RepID=A0A2G2W0E3_CAPBA|nr:hypothetical protein CQW23_22271 [Capsicum baccatum]
MAKQFDLVDARKLFQQVNVKKLPHLALLQGKKGTIDDSGKLSNFWSDFFIGLCSSFVTLRLNDDLIVEPYNPHRFSRQFEFCQDVIGILTKHHFDGSLLTLVQLWDSCVHLGSLSKLNIPMRPLDNGPFVTQEYSNCWSDHRETMLRQNTHIILRGSKKNDASSSTKEDQLQLDDGAAGSIMPLANLAHQLGLVDIFSNIFGEDYVTSPNPPSVLKSPNLSFDNAMTQASNKDPSAKLPENVESFQNVPTTDMMAEANDNRTSNVPKDLVRPL